MTQPKSLSSHQTRWIASILGASLILTGCSASPPEAEPGAIAPSTPAPAVSATPEIPIALTPAPANWRDDTHIHGLGVSPDNPNILYVATHHGLLQRSETGQWAWVGEKRDDLMGFTVHPTEGDRFYSSGHPPTGGNLGFRMSEDKGQNWQLVSMEGMDFHTMAIAPSNPQVIYGFAGNVLASEDGGKTWQPAAANGLEAPPFGLVVDPSDPNHVYATTQAGVFESRNGGQDWAVMPGTQEAPLVGLTLAKSGDTTTLFAYRLTEDAPGLYRSTNQGQTWQKLNTPLDGIAMYGTVAPTQPEIIYVATEHNNILQSVDGGETWKRLD